MPVMREATPGAMRLPSGAKDRETIRTLQDGLAALKARVDALEAAPKAQALPPPDKDALVLRAVELGVGNASTLARWGVEKLSNSIAEKEAAI